MYFINEYDDPNYKETPEYTATPNVRLSWKALSSHVSIHKITKKGDNGEPI